MKIKKIYFKEHKIFGELTLDFTDENNNAVDTIILAGENGTGKTMILEMIYNFVINIFGSQSEYGKVYSISIETSEEEREYLKSDPVNININHKKFINEDSDFKEMIFEFDYRDKEMPRKVIITRRDKTQVSYDMNIIFIDIFFALQKTILSDTEINFKGRIIESITSKLLDNVKNGGIRPPADLAREIAQLLVDIRAQDNEDFAKWGTENTGLQKEIVNPEKRMSRFTKAFSYMFEKKRLKGIVTRNNAKIILFEENNNEIRLDQLSSGEKQIVYRGSFLLQNIESMRDAVILIDEPEISMHPRWQQKILNFYKMLFTNNEGVQRNQIIVATHSPFIIHNANRYNDKIIVLSKNEKGEFVIQKNSTFYTWGNEEAIQKAFDINMFVSDIPLVLLEGETDELYFKTAMKIFDLGQDVINYKCVGIKDEKGNSSNSGKTFLDHAYNFLKSNPYFIRKKVILLYDCDAMKENHIESNLIIHCLKREPNMWGVENGIENLFDLSVLVSKEEYYSLINKRKPDGGSIDVRNLNKSKLCQTICKELVEDKQKIVLGKLKNVIQEIKTLVC